MNRASRKLGEVFFLFLDLPFLPLWNSDIRSELQQPFGDIEDRTYQDGDTKRIKEPESLVTS